jgi:hypothetical protein
LLHCIHALDPDLENKHKALKDSRARGLCTASRRAACFCVDPIKRWGLFCCAATRRVACEVPLVPAKKVIAAPPHFG